MDREIVLIAHNIRSCHNVGSLIRTAEGLGITKIYFSGYTPYPIRPKDERLPHEAAKIAKQINKTALGAEYGIAWEHFEGTVPELLRELKGQGHQLCALEQSPTSIPVHTWQPPSKVTIILGSEVEGIASDLLGACDAIIEIPMFGKKESFNVVQAAAMLLYRLRFLS